MAAQLRDLGLLWHPLVATVIGLSVMAVLAAAMLNRRFLILTLIITDLIAMLQATSPSTQPTTSASAPSNDPIVELTIVPNAALCSIPFKRSFCASSTC